VLLGAAWTGFWFYAAQQAQAVLAAWSAREAQAGRLYHCERLSMAGFPFRLEATCVAPGVDLTSDGPPVHIAAARIQAVADIFHPTVLVADLIGPLTIAVTGAPPARATWSRAEARLSGSPAAPGRLSMQFEDLAIDQMPATKPLFRARRAAAETWLVSGTVTHDPVVAFELALAGATAPGVHPLTEQPVDLAGKAVVYGLDDLRPLPPPKRLRQLQAAGGRLEIAQCRISQGDAVATASGQIGLSASGRPNGALQVTAAGFERVLSQLGIDKLLPSAQASQVAPAIGMLDSILPGLGQVVRNNAGLGVAAGLAMISKPAQLEGRPARAFPLRLTDGAVFLGPVHVGNLLPVY
jgi:hypothetical protein